jgi:predicted DNA-binding protein YlxM (UPF0122 family)
MATVIEQITQNMAIIDIAKELKVQRNAVYQSINGGGSRKIRVHIAVKLGKKPSELWTDNDHESIKLDNALYFMQVGYYEQESVQS